MKEVIKKYKVYEYNELSEEIKEKLLEKQIDNCQNDYGEFFLKEDMEYKAKELLKKYFGKNAEFIDVLYDLSYCQGSGAMIEFKIKYYNCDIRVKNNGNYCHQYSFILYYEDFKYLSEDRKKKLKEKIAEMNNELTKYGYSLLDYDNFIEQAKDLLQEEMFLENGEIFEA